MTQLSLLPNLPKATTEVVYYATDLCNIKIGRSVNPRRRGGELRAEMLLTFPGGQFEERRHQRMWRQYRIGASEWFRADSELLLWLDLQIERDTRAAIVLRQLAYSVLSGRAA